MKDILQAMFRTGGVTGAAEREQQPAQPECVARTLLHHFEGAGLKDSVSSCNPPSMAPLKADTFIFTVTKNPGRQEDLGAGFLPDAAKAERQPLATIDLAAPDQAAKYQRNTSPHAVRLDNNSPAGKQHMSFEEPSSRCQAEHMMNDVKAVGDWKLLSLLGMGGMSNVYLAQHKLRPRQYSAIKLSKDFILDFDDKENDPCYTSTLLEWRTYQLFRKPPASSEGKMSSNRPRAAKRKLLQGSVAESRPYKAQKVALPDTEAGAGTLPTAYGYGFVEMHSARRHHGWLSLQLLGTNLHAVASSSSKPLTWSSFYKLATGMLAAVKELHACNLMHRDIKPGNFCLGLNADAGTVYLVDFGFVLPLPKKKEALGTEKFCGTPDFASSNALRGGRYGAKDDCESLCYSYMQLWNYGVIPWDITRLTPKPVKQGAYGLATAAELTSSEDNAGWTPKRLHRMADNRACIWADMEREGEIPPFLLSWQLYLSSLAVWELPDYDLLQKLLHNSCLYWDEHHTTGRDCCASPEPVISSIETAPGAEPPKAAFNPLLAAEE